MPRTKSSRAWLDRQHKDPFVKRARKEGARSRAIYKLEEIDRRDRLFRAGMVVVDLGAAPGGWSEYAVRRVLPGGRVVALDLLPMAEIPGVEFIQGDFADAAVLDSLKERLGGQRVDLVISDMAPNISGIAAADQARSMGLSELALDFADQALRAGGDLLLKTFQGEGFKELHQQMLRRFERVLTRKPKASRGESREVYLLGRGRRP
ncbi:23S rRNA methyltransferase [Sulfurifustis variabilis]|uniref:Ribosomal RNA large subunit methyltransferase E n=1 Tax=Sulfurifustis variabilis TaxID=1675686 RepID=A0A1B4V5Z5_9GAMM|nr:RlmE family RNA methyltransferase [Sulfurifustis variabilis]BAU48973.1 23S rRNA methyltransferase [Sulfurifustis variabilis]